MKTFTYNDYLDFPDDFKVSYFTRLEEESESYFLNQEKNIILKKELLNALKKEEEMKKFMEHFLKFECDTKDKLILYESNLKKENINPPDLIYYFRKKEMFFMIYYLEKQDHQIIFQILNSCLLIMKQWQKQNQKRKNLHYPVIVPIVLYLGNDPWKFDRSPKKLLKKYTFFQRYGMHLAYNLIDIHQYSLMELQKGTSYFNKILLENKYLQINKKTIDT